MKPPVTSDLANDNGKLEDHLAAATVALRKLLQVWKRLLNCLPPSSPRQSQPSRQFKTDPLPRSASTATSGTSLTNPPRGETGSGSSGTSRCRFLEEDRLHESCASRL